jgi:hypothetical protein
MAHTASHSGCKHILKGGNKMNLLDAYNSDLLTLLSYRPEFSVNVHQKDYILMEAKKYKDVLVVEVSPLKDGMFHISLWSKEFCEEDEE